ncbi:MAG: hypothetical protein WKF97_23730 [Chitinophagaceae bacterium]
MAKYHCLNSLLFFTRYFFKIRLNKRFVVGEHHQIISNTLEKVIRGQLLRVIFHVAPRYGKTELAVKSLIAHGLALNPSAKFIHLSYSDDLALDNSEQIKEIVQSEEYQQMFPDVQIKQGTDSKKKWYTDEGGGVYATSASGQVTGFGAGTIEDEENDLKEFLDDIEAKEVFGGAIIIDDPIKPDDADSDTLREKVNNRFDSTIRNRVNSRKTPIVIIMQKLHENDLSGYLQGNEPDAWHVVNIPVIKPDGTALWPYKHTIEELRALQKANEKVFDCQYLQDPSTKAGKLFPKTELSFYNPEMVDVEKLAEYRIGAIDPAEEGSDDLSFPIGYLVEDKLYVVDWIYNQNGTNINEPACIEKIINYKLNNVVIESNSAWVHFTRAVRASVNERYEDCEIRAVSNRTNKATRIWAQSAFIKINFIFRSDYHDHPEYERAMKNLLYYNKSQEGASKNKHEDAPDSLAELANWLRQNMSHLWKN